jgi:hypothetical protein
LVPFIAQNVFVKLTKILLIKHLEVITFFAGILKMIKLNMDKTRYAKICT